MGSVKSAVAAVSVSVLLVGCSVRPPEVFREKCRKTYTVEVERGYEDAHRLIVAAMFKVGWGEAANIHQELQQEQGRGSTWAFYPDQRGPIGFIIDVERIGENRTKVTVYPENRFYARKSREMIERAVKQRQGDPALRGLNMLTPGHSPHPGGGPL